MVLIAVMLVIGMMVVELTIVNALPWLRRLLMRYPILSLGFSLAVSICLGWMFPAVGLIVMAGGIFSTVLMRPYYTFLAKRETHQQRRAERRANPTPKWYHVAVASARAEWSRRKAA